MSDAIARALYGAPPVDNTPLYPALPQVEKWRKIARRAGSIKAMDPADVYAYGEAVLKAIGALKRSAWLSATGPVNPTPHCASGTAINDPGALRAAVRRRHMATLHSQAERDRRARKDEDIIADYEEAMAEKRARLEAAPAPALIAVALKVNAPPLKNPPRIITGIITAPATPPAAPIAPVAPPVASKAAKPAKRHASPRRAPVIWKPFAPARPVWKPRPIRLAPVNEARP